MMDDAETHFWGPLGVLGPTWCVLGLRFRAEAICGVERQFLSQFGRSTPVFDPFLALDARIG